MVDDNLIWKVEMEEYRLWEGVWSFRVQKIMKQRSIADEEAAAAAMIGWLVGCPSLFWRIQRPALARPLKNR